MRQERELHSRVPVKEPDAHRRAIVGEVDFGQLFDDLRARADVAARGEALRLREWLELAEGWYIARALRECRGNRAAAARRLGIGRRTLYSRMAKLGIEPVWSFPFSPPR